MTTWVWKNRTRAGGRWMDGRTDGRMASDRPAEADSTASGRQKERSDESGKVQIHEGKKERTREESQLVLKIRNSKT